MFPIPAAVSCNHNLCPHCESMSAVVSRSSCHILSTSVGSIVRTRDLDMESGFLIHSHLYFCLRRLLATCQVYTRFFHVGQLTSSALQNLTKSFTSTISNRLYGVGQKYGYTLLKIKAITFRIN